MNVDQFESLQVFCVRLRNNLGYSLDQTYVEDGIFCLNVRFRGKVLVRLAAETDGSGWDRDKEVTVSVSRVVDGRMVDEPFTVETLAEIEEYLTTVSIL